MLAWGQSAIMFMLFKFIKIFFFFFFFAAAPRGMWDLVPQPGMEPVPPTVEAQS